MRPKDKDGAVTREVQVLAQHSIVSWHWDFLKLVENRNAKVTQKIIFSVPF